MKLERRVLRLILFDRAMLAHGLAAASILEYKRKPRTIAQCDETLI